MSKMRVIRLARCPLVLLCALQVDPAGDPTAAYEWQVNGNVVRDVVSVGMADALSCQHAISGNNLEVTITAGDGFGGVGLGATAPALRLSTQVQ